MFLKKAFLLIEFLITFLVFISCITVISSFLYLNFKIQNRIKLQIENLDYVLNYIESYNLPENFMENSLDNKNLINKNGAKINISSIKISELFFKENIITVKNFIINNIEINGQIYEFS